jgi:hydroxyethylthiazole kinase
MSGAVDVIADGNRVAFVENGHPLMGSISGTGCMASSMTGAFVAIASDRFAATVAALAAFGLAGERAAERAMGPGTFRWELFDALARMEPAELADGVRIRFE